MIVGVAEASGAILASAELYDPTTGTFAATGAMTGPREGFTATPFVNGSQILIAGGFPNLGGETSASADLYNPATGKFTSTGEMTRPRANHTATLTNNGQILIAGGQTRTEVLGGGELYAPGTGKFTVDGGPSPRYGDTATLLPSPFPVLIAGGIIDGMGTRTASSVYIGSGEPPGSMSSPRANHTATLLGNGKVLIAGGTSSTTEALSSAELYNQTTGKFEPTGSMTEARAGHTATLLGNGKVLIAGGYKPHFPVLATTASAELYDPTTGKFEPTGPMTEARRGHTATLLGNGKVLIAGGTTSTEALASSELYDPTTGKFEPTGSMKEARANHTATLLTNGKVLVAGGTTVFVPPSPHFYSNKVVLPEESGGPGAEGRDIIAWGTLTLETKTVGTITCRNELGGDAYNPVGGGAGEGKIDGWVAYDCTNELCESVEKAKQEIIPEGLAGFGEWEAKLTEAVEGKPRLKIGNSTLNSPTQIKFFINCTIELKAKAKGELSPLVVNGGAVGLSPSKVTFDAEAGELEIANVKEGKVSGSLKLMGYEGGELISSKSP
jgi:Galactose oxidase, central domain